MTTKSAAIKSPQKEKSLAIAENNVQIPGTSYCIYEGQPNSVFD